MYIYILYLHIIAYIFIHIYQLTTPVDIYTPYIGDKASVDPGRCLIVVPPVNDWSKLCRRVLGINTAIQNEQAILWLNERFG